MHAFKSKILINTNIPIISKVILFLRNTDLTLFNVLIKEVRVRLSGMRTDGKTNLKDNFELLLN